MQVYAFDFLQLHWLQWAMPISCAGSFRTQLLTQGIAPIFVLVALVAFTVVLRPLLAIAASDLCPMLVPLLLGALCWLLLVRRRPALGRSKPLNAALVLLALNQLFPRWRQRLQQQLEPL